MLAFEVLVNDERLCLAGAEDWAVLNVSLSGVKHRHPSIPDADEVDLYVGALTQPDLTGASYHLRWKGLRGLPVGTKVTFNVVETDRVDEPIRRHRSDSEVQEPEFTVEELEEFEWEDYLRLKAKFEPSSA